MSYVMLSLTHSFIASDHSAIGSCEALTWISTVLTATAQFVAAGESRLNRMCAQIHDDSPGWPTAFTAQRAYALSGGRMWIGMITFILAIVECVVYLVSGTARTSLRV